MLHASLGMLTLSPLAPGAPSRPASPGTPDRPFCPVSPGPPGQPSSPYNQIVTLATPCSSHLVALVAGKPRKSMFARNATEAGLALGTSQAFWSHCTMITYSATGRL